MATVNPVEHFDKSNDLGTIELRKFSEPGLLDANPLEHIANTKRINTVSAAENTFRDKRRTRRSPS